MKENMPGATRAAPTYDDYGRLVSNGYTDMGPTRRWRSDRSAHRGDRRWLPGDGRDYDPTGVDASYEKPHPNSLLGRAKRDGDSKTLYAVTEGRMAEEE